jgi:hypothetical protein
MRLGRRILQRRARRKQRMVNYLILLLVFYWIENLVLQQNAIKFCQIDEALIAGLILWFEARRDPPIKFIGVLGKLLHG